MFVQFCASFSFATVHFSFCELMQKEDLDPFLKRKCLAAGASSNRFVPLAKFPGKPSAHLFELASPQLNNHTMQKEKKRIKSPKNSTFWVVFKNACEELLLTSIFIPVF